MNKSDLDKMIDIEASENCSIPLEHRNHDDIYMARITFSSIQISQFKSGASFMHGILLPEIEKLNQDIELHQKINTSDGKLIQSLKAENQRFREALENMPSTFDELAKSLRNGSRSEEHNIWAHDTCLIVKSFIDAVIIKKALSPQKKESE